ncbi:ATPase [Microcoleus sp. FACHB-1515]|uniref:TrkH family potassium uptake protein n=1 Tax=Cyanophyceae TaxID=3028117 RepID=UPI001681F9F7|nr:TrkH family potassium uptake protein [Microcoleus sp. FACHB-1515]MBD2089211.1 ATPase [Microcoleus sp. FACHB-1515]
MTVSRTICLGFLAVIAIGTLLLLLPGATSSGDWNDPIVALFTSTSAVCVTGHIIVDTGTYFSDWGHVVIAALVQIGGLGYMTATTFLLLLLGRRFGLRDKVAVQQALDRPGLEGVSQVIQSIIATTLLFELTGALLMIPVFLPDHDFGRAVWLALFHSITAWNNAGFSLFSDNLVGYQSSWLINLVIPGLIIFGGIGYEAIFEMYLWLRSRLHRGKQPSIERPVLSLNFKVAVSTTLVLLVLGTIGLFLTEVNNPGTLAPLDPVTRLLTAWFAAVTPRTAGFNTINVGEMTTAGLFISIALMFIGGSPGSTAGGIKTTTLRVLTRSTVAVLRGQETVQIYERQLPIPVILKAIAVAVGSIITLIVMTGLITISDPQLDFIQILFEVVSAFCTVGLSTGITAGLSVFAKLVLVATMYIGRVGVLLLIGALLGDPKPTVIRFPQENLLVG